MHRSIVSLEEYITRINDKLREHPLYRGGMRVARGPDLADPHRLDLIDDSGGAFSRMPFAWAQMHVDLACRLEGDAPITLPPAAVGANG